MTGMLPTHWQRDANGSAKLCQLTGNKSAINDKNFRIKSLSFYVLRTANEIP